MSSAQLGVVLRHIRKLAAAEPGGKQTDRQLLELFLARRDEEAFTELVKRHGPMVLKVCRSVLRDWHDAEDAFQATFLVLARKAAAIRRREALASWLWGVALKLALKAQASLARRRKREGQVGDKIVPDPVLDMTVRELQRVLHEELQRLPERYRTPLILCYLQGHSQEEAARQLGLSKGVMRGRLNRGREQLRGRLTRRGLAVSAGLVASALSATSASALPAALLEATAHAVLVCAAGKTAAASAVSKQAAALADGAIRSMFVSKCKIAALVVMVLSMMAAGAGALARHAELPPQATAAPARMEKNAASGESAATASSEKPGVAAAGKNAATEVTVSGQVVDDDGRPLAGATLHVGNKKVRDTVNLPVRATTGADGRFQVLLAAKDRGTDKFLMAKNAGRGPDWIDLEKFNASKEVTLRLTKDDIPVAGRFLDLEAKPMAGLTVTATHVEQHPQGLKGYIAMYRAKAGTPYFVAQQFHDPPMRWLRSNVFLPKRTTKTDKDGRFQFTGFGRDRIVHIEVTGNSIEHLYLSVLTSPEPVTGVPQRNLGAYGTNFTYLADPTKPITGTVYEKGTGKLLSGIRVTCPDHVAWPQAMTDANGKFRIPNHSKDPEYMIAAEGKSHFFQFKWQIRDTPGLEPVMVDFYLERGLKVRGKVLDKVTGNPVKGKVHYFAKVDNPYLKDYKDLATNRPIITKHEEPGWQGDIQADGSFWVLAVPGPGYLGVQGGDDTYPPARLKDWDGKPIPVVENQQQYPQMLHPGQLLPQYYNWIIPINPLDSDPSSLRCDILLEPGSKRAGSVQGPDGKPLADVHVAGLAGRATAHWFYSGRPLFGTLKTADFTVVGLSASQERKLVFLQAERNLGKVVTVKAGENDPLTVRLEPLGSLTGRVVDRASQPIANRQVTVQLSRQPEDYRDLPYELNVDNYVTHSPLTEPASWRGLTARTVKTDATGKFHVDGLLPGVKYEIRVYVSAQEKKPDQLRLEDAEAISGSGVSMESGRARDIGTLHAQIATAK
jgi:RNA polymerase sigma factor (sigma-70 family)